MKQIPFLFLAFFLLFFSLNVLAADIYISTKNGSDRNAGTKEKPLYSLQMALRKARELRRIKHASTQNGIKIWIEGGVYTLEEAILLYPEDSGTPESPTEICAIPNASVIFSGGNVISNWKRVNTHVSGLPKAAEGKVWEATVPSHDNQSFLFRQLWVNGKKAVWAKNEDGNNMGRILSWNSEKQTCKIPLPKNIDITHIKGMEMLIQQWWAIANLRVKSVKVIGNEAELSFMQPESRIQSEHPWPAPWISDKTGNSAFYLTNAIQFLNQPGEWFEDVKNNKVYYWPREGENMQQVHVVAPFLENLLKIEGTLDNPVHNIIFKGISFQHASWLRPSKVGHVPHQAGMYMLDAYKIDPPGTLDKQDLENQGWVGRPAAAVFVRNGNHIDFLACQFKHMASTALDYEKGTHNNRIEGNLFKDIGGSGILMGVFSDEATEVHLPYNPSDQREVSSNNLIQNNLITDVTNEDWGCVGIGAGYVRGIKILNNEVNNVSYTGISVGWGWTKTLNAMKNNLISRNKVHHYGKHLYDVAGIYTLSAQPESFITENYIDSIYHAPYAHLPEHWFYLYTDEGSSYLTVKDNWTPSGKFLQNANGPDNVWQNNGPVVADSIKNNAGLQKNYQYLLRDNTPVSQTRAVNQIENKKVVIETIFSGQKLPTKSTIRRFAKANNLANSSVYVWNNRMLVYTNFSNFATIQKSLKQQFKHLTVKLYDNMFYDFNREKNCGEKPVKEWDNIILSANLVKDYKLQKEYLKYHASQFEKWPEVSKGFCNANFQQLVIYRNGRQLMLIISIPKGENLDKLNPKTTENNPRVDEWNALMKKYQEGIDGTKPGETWVFFKPINEL
ncbi:L-rhamnose mutarotase [Pedobacter sp. MW01-1-1]|uniref:L-rhamnose mutarotase n=1 Tax=Pedobacter sp. MW01-1-1 TaxID=3383027 RepID=UPI003FEE3D06